MATKKRQRRVSVRQGPSTLASPELRGMSHGPYYTIRANVVVGGEGGARGLVVVSKDKRRGTVELNESAMEEWGAVGNRTPTATDLRNSRFAVLTRQKGFIPVKLTEAERKRMASRDDPSVLFKKAVAIADRAEKRKR